MIVLDASVMIGHLDANDPHHTKARSLIESSGATPLGASVISLAETLVAPARARRLDDARAALERLGIVELGLDPEAPAQLARLRAETSCKLPDCCVLLAAQGHHGAVASFDRGLMEAAEQLGIPLATA